MSDSIRSFQGKSPSIGMRVYIDPKSVVIGSVTLGDDVSVWPMAVIRGDVNHISIGNFCSIQDGAILHVTHDGPYTVGGKPLILGQGVTVGHQAVLHGCTIDDYCLIGMGSLILDAVHVHHHVIIGAGSVVTPGKILDSGYLYLGNPARAVRKLTSQEFEQLEYSAQHYVRLKNHYLEI
jgi:carbonic anhydrase/acetyltransferase-like protein (isoleucine patch superfamily)